MGILFLLLLLLSAGCIGNSPHATSHTTSYTIEEVPMEGFSKGISLEAYPGYVEITHNLSYVCCAELEVREHWEGDTLILEEVNRGKMCRCPAWFSIHIKVKGQPFRILLKGVAYKGEGGEIEPEVVALFKRLGDHYIRER